MYHDLDVSYDVVGSSVVIQADGEIDLGTAGRLDGLVREVLDGQFDPKTIVLDMSGVRFLATAGLTLLKNVQEQCASDGIVLWIVAGSRAVTRPLALTGLTASITVLPSREESMSDESVTSYERSV